MIYKFRCVISDENNNTDGFQGFVWGNSLAEAAGNIESMVQEVEYMLDVKINPIKGTEDGALLFTEEGMTMIEKEGY